MAAEGQDYYRYCPGEEHLKLSDAVCYGRRRANFRKCPGCQFNDDEQGRPTYYGANVQAGKNIPLAVLERDKRDMIQKVFKAYDVRATYPDPLNEDVAWRIGNATAQFLRTALVGYDRSDSTMNTLIVGRDMRKSSPALSRAFIEGAAAVGTPVIDIGMVDTPQIYFAANHMPCCGGVITTASHNPPNYNGFKISGVKGKPIGAESGLQEIERIARAISKHPSPETNRVQSLDLSADYRGFLHKLMREPRPLKVVVDASNGMAGRWFPIVFNGVPNLTVIALNFETSGEFVHPPNPLVLANLAQLRAAVKEHRADFGACFDGDADRCVFVDEHGEFVRCDLITAMLAIEYLRERPGATIVYDLRSSRILPEVIEKNGGRPRRERVGHVFMKRTMADQNAVFGGELSGHLYFRDFYYCDSGLIAFIAVCNALTRTGKPLSELIEPLAIYASSGERNFENPDKEGTFKRLLDKYRDGEIDQLDGVTVQYKDWWFNVRASNTEPLMRLNMEAINDTLLNAKLAELTPLLGTPAEGH
ncbi:MAG: phosphomannomutase/phosphoglucomutase [Phycisphaerales bacterium]|nr:phosphomannomutase/phosphoglucomutase [Phycisphaerales bacterium]